MTQHERFQRRARPHLGTLVEVGVVAGDSHRPTRCADAAIDAAFARVVEIESLLSRFDPRSMIGRFNAAAAGTSIPIGEDAQIVLVAADHLRAASGGVFDISVGSGCDDWACDGLALIKLSDDVRLDLGGIAKGHAVDVAVGALQQAGASAGWVNAGGDLRVFGALALPIDLRDESNGGVRRFASLEDGAFATSWIAEPMRHAIGADSNVRRATAHASVAAERCLWADALTKIVALTGDACHPLLVAHGARAWLH